MFFAWITPSQPQTRRPLLHQQRQTRRRGRRRGPGAHPDLGFLDPIVEGARDPVSSRIALAVSELTPRVAAATAAPHKIRVARRSISFITQFLPLAADRLSCQLSLVGQALTGSVITIPLQEDLGIELPIDAIVHAKEDDLRGNLVSNPGTDQGEAMRNQTEIYRYSCFSRDRLASGCRRCAGPVDGSRHRRQPDFRAD